MAQTTLLTSISRTDTFPKMVNISAPSHRGCISIATDNWTPQMFYELPAIKFEIYTIYNSEYVKYKDFCYTLKTYNPVLSLDSIPEIAAGLSDIPADCYIAITPNFDKFAIDARNLLIDNGLEFGDKWNAETDTFSITIKFTD